MAKALLGLLTTTVLLLQVQSELVGYWPLSSDTVDYSGQGTNLQSGSLAFDTSDPPPFGASEGYAVFGQNGLSWARYVDWLPPISDAFTFEFWFKRTQRTNASKGRWGVFLSVHGTPFTTNGADTFWISTGITNEGGGRCGVNLYPSSNNDDLLGSDANRCSKDDSWHHLAVTRGADGTVNLYIDGNLDATTTSSDGVNDGTVGNLVLGQEQDGPNTGSADFDTSQAFSGYMTELRVWNVTRTAEQIAANMNTRCTAGCINEPAEQPEAVPEPSSCDQPSELVGYWPLAGNVEDLSSQGTDLESGSLAFDTSDPPPFGAIERYAVFGQNSLSWARYVDWLPPISDAFTFEFWFKRTQRTNTGNGGWGVFLSVHGTPFTTNGADTFWISTGITNEGGGRCGVNLYPSSDNDDLLGSDANRCSKDDSWHHLAVTRGADGTVKMYIDGNLDATTTSSDGVNDGTVGNLVLGQEQDGPGTGSADFDTSQAFSGYMTELRVWNVTRTAEQIADNMNVRLSWCCGNGVLEAGNNEECDDGNLLDGDGCGASCVSEVCGNGVLQPAAREECDDSNTESGDGCSSACVIEEALCDLVRSCGEAANETCTDSPARQSTFYDYNDIPTAYLLDGDKTTCVKTADAQSDPNPQWVRVAFDKARLVGTVRFWSAGSASDLKVMVTQDDAPASSALNPSTGAPIPVDPELCTVEATAESDVFEAYCGPATKGRFVFILAAAPQQILEVCDVEVFEHQCLAADEEVSCGLGLEPSACESCRGCVPCAAGWFSDKVGAYGCTPCPGQPQPYSPPGSTSVFQCEGYAYLDGTSTLAVDAIVFNQSLDAWEIDIEYSEGPHVQVNGFATVFLSNGGAAFDSNIYQANNFPCRADSSEAAGADLSTSLEETVCCLQDMRQDYVMTNIFRSFTDTLDLVAANDICDSEAGSNELVNAVLEVVGKEGTMFVNTAGESFANPITVVPIECASEAPERRSHEYYTGKQCARITLPDAELYKVSRTLNPEQDLTDSRELFVGLLDMLPTGTRVVDSSSQQIKIVLTRTQYGTFAAYGRQNIDYDFISYLNARVHEVLDKSVAPARRGQYDEAYYAEISYVYDESLNEENAGVPVVLSTVTVDYGDGPKTACASGNTVGGSPANPVLDLDDFVGAISQTCGPANQADLQWDATSNVCPQVSLPDDHFGRLYIPLWTADEAPSTAPDTVHISLELLFADDDDAVASLQLELDVVVDNFVTWCDAADASVDLTANVVPQLLIGTESSNPPRITDFAGPAGSEAIAGESFTTEAETLQDGLITMALDITDEEEGLEIFFEDVLIVQINPGSVPNVGELKDQADFIPQYEYDPDSRDAWLVLPPALNESCPEATFSESFFGCVHKHLFKDEKITNPEWAYLVGSDAPPGVGAQDFMQTMLGSGTASVAARELGRDYEQYLVSSAENMGTKQKIGLWINPGHVWGQTVHNSEYSLSEHVIVYVLYGVRSGVDGGVTRRLLQTSSGGNTMVTKTLKYDVTAASLVESVLDDVVAVQVEADLPLSATEACEADEQLKELCSARLEAAVAPHASTQVVEVACVSITVGNADCGGARRSAADPFMRVDAVIALEASPGAAIDIAAVQAAGRVLSITQTAGQSAEAPESPSNQVDGTPAASDEPDESGSGSSTAVIGAAAGAAAGVVVAALVAWRASKRCRTRASLTEVVSTGAVPAGVVQTGSGSEKARIEGMFFAVERQ